MKCNHRLFGQQDGTETRPASKRSCRSGTAGRDSQTSQTRTPSAGTGRFKNERSSTPAPRRGSASGVVFSFFFGALGSLHLHIAGVQGGVDACVFFLPPCPPPVDVDGDKRRLEVDRAQQLVPEWAAIHESNRRIRMVFVTFDMPLASMVSTVDAVGNGWKLPSLHPFLFSAVWPRRCVFEREKKKASC